MPTPSRTSQPDVFATLRTVGAFGLLTAVLGHIQFAIPGISVRSNFAELGILMAVPFVPHWTAAMGVAAFTAFNVAPSGSVIAYTGNHMAGAYFAWHFIRAAWTIQPRWLFGATCTFGVALYYAVVVSLIGVGMVLVGRIPAGEAWPMTRSILTSLPLEIAVTMAVVSLFFVNRRDRQELAESQRHIARLTAAIEQNPIAVVICTIDGVIDYVNQRMLTATGLARHALERHRWQEFAATHPALALPDAAWDDVRAGRVWRGELRTTAPSGATRWEAVSLSPIADRSGTVRFAVALRLDTSAMVQLRDQLFQSQKMETIGTLAGGIAHDFNNVLTAIKGFIGLAQLQGKDDARLLGYLASASTASDRAGDLVRQLMTASRKREFELTKVCLGELMQEVGALLRASVAKAVAIEVRLATDACVLGDATLLHQILMNLGTNAAFAMRDGGGRLTMMLEQVTVSWSGEPGTLQPPAGEYVRLTVSDTGCGIAPHNLHRIFDPYFTTKPVDKGTGLGLSVVRGAVEAMHGTITVESELGRGSVFTVLLPRIVEGAA